MNLAFRMLQHTSQLQIHKRKFLQHALSCYVYNRSLFDIFTQVEMAEGQECLQIVFITSSDFELINLFMRGLGVK